MAQIIQVPVVVSITEVRCDCGRTMEWDGLVLASNPPQYKHWCSVCRKFETLRTRAGHLEYKREFSEDSAS